ncbi:zf-TFIIB domain-containing protein [Herminiimonas fonticola]|uniref:Transcription factor zinc-finger domain-containing protein n=1 Tax=Herminiimonas fonticola TaxID=303380 RepID=A0A4R6G372_9BURK|nr:zf-TFIIB domain-containing protein [Herminiimonas fonticola]RBA23475.1 hypothetical protein Hfont_2286 [Herminiimonas fonticola]TDN88270.1 hypothetical protein EV677_2757 [Herminiimonas fonticola]
MDCPVCQNTKLLMSDRKGIEIDYCPNCRGVWLDRGELDKIIERSTEDDSAPSRPQSRAEPSQGQQYQQQGFGHNQQTHNHQQQGHYKKKKGGFLGELFDFD